MYKKLLPFVFISTFFLIACNQATEETHSSKPSESEINLSSNNTVDIQDDLKLLDQLSNRYSKSMLNMQDEINISIENKDISTIPNLFEQFKKQTYAFNNALDEEKFKSKEVKLVSNLFKQVHMLTLNLVEEEIKDSPDQTRIDEIKNKMAILQRSIVIEIQRLQYLLNQASNTTKTENQTVTKTTIQQPVNESVISSQSVQKFSQNNQSDIKSDLLTLFATTQAAKQKFEHALSEMGKATKKDSTSFKNAVLHTQQSLIELNQQYDSVSLKSTEVNQIREKLKQEGNIQIEMSKIILSPVPDKQRFADLQQKMSILSTSIRQDVKALQH